jgi:hypothetical protein
MKVNYQNVLESNWLVDLFPKLLYNGNMQIILKANFKVATSVRNLICQLIPREPHLRRCIEPLPLAMVGETGWLKNLLQS